MDTFRAVVLGDYIPVARFVGLDPYAILKRAQIDPQLLDDPDTLLSLRRVIQVLEESAALSGRDDFGILLAETRTFSSLGPISLLMQHESSIRGVVEAAAEFKPLLSSAFSILLQEELDVASIHFIPPGSHASPQPLSHVVAVGSTVLVDASGGKWHPAGAHFRHAPPKWISTHERHFECPLTFHNVFDGLTCPVRSLDFPVRSAEPVLATYARRLLSQFPGVHDNGSVTHHVRDAIQLLLPHGAPTLSKVSANLARPPRTV